MRHNSVILALLLCGCAMKHVQVQTVPGCSKAHVEAPKGCELVQYPDKLEVQCRRQVINQGRVVTEIDVPVVYTCTSKKEK